MVHIPRWGFWVGPVEPSLGNPDPLALGCASGLGFWTPPLPGVGSANPPIAMSLRRTRSRRSGHLQ